MPHFPSTKWNGFSWTGEVSIDGFGLDGPAELEIRCTAKTGSETPPHASPAQAEAFRFLLDHGPEVWNALLTALRDRVPEWADWPLRRIAGEVVLSHLTVHLSEWDGVAYVGYWLTPAHVDSWLSEHGAGVTAHRYRVVAIEMGEESRTGKAAENDARRLKKAFRGVPPRRG